MSDHVLFRRTDHCKNETSLLGSSYLFGSENETGLLSILVNFQDAFVRPHQWEALEEAF